MKRWWISYSRADQSGLGFGAMDIYTEGLAPMSELHEVRFHAARITGARVESIVIIAVSEIESDQ